MALQLLALCAAAAAGSIDAAPDPEHTYVITWANATSGWCVDLSGGATSNGTEIELWDCNVSAALSVLCHSASRWGSLLMLTRPERPPARTGAGSEEPAVGHGSREGDDPVRCRPDDVPGQPG